MMKIEVDDATWWVEEMKKSSKSWKIYIQNHFEFTRISQIEWLPVVGRCKWIWRVEQTTRVDLGTRSNESFWVIICGRSACFIVKLKWNWIFSLILFQFHRNFNSYTWNFELEVIKVALNLRWYKMLNIRKFVIRGAIRDKNTLSSLQSNTWQRQYARVFVFSQSQITQLEFDLPLP